LKYWIEDIVKNEFVIIKLLRYHEKDNHSVDYSILNKLELIEFKGYKSKKRQLEYYYTRVLWQMFNIKDLINYRPTGKPIIDQGHISISHSHNCIAIAYSKTNELGLDIEYFSEKIRKVKHKFLHPKENYTDLVDLTKAWCIKEAVYKLMDMDDAFFMDDICIPSLKGRVKPEIWIKDNCIKTEVEILALPNKMMLAYAYQKK